MKRLFQQKTGTNWNCHHVDLFCATPPLTLGRQLSETALLCCHPLVYFLKVVVKNQPLPNCHQRRQKIKREPKRSKGIQRDQKRSRESKRDHKNSQEIAQTKKKRSRGIKRDQERSKESTRDQKISKEIKRDQERSREIEKGPLHEVEEATRTGNTRKATVDQVNLVVESGSEKELLQGIKITRRNDGMQHKLHAKASRTHVWLQSQHVCVCVIYIPMQSTVTCVNVSFWGSNRQIYIVDMVVQICKDLGSVRKLCGLQLRCVNLPGEVEVKSPFRCATLPFACDLCNRWLGHTCLHVP